MNAKKTLGIVGGGQLGRMLSEPAIKLGYGVIVVDPTDNCPAKQVGARQIIAGFRDEKAIRELAKNSDFITIESEHVNVKALSEILDKKVNPSSQTIELIQDKYKQKQFLKDSGLPVADFVEINSVENARLTLAGFGGKMMLKSKTDAFDGRGNALVSSVEELDAAFLRFEKRELYAEQIITFEKELAVMVAKDIKGNIVSYPVVETVHKRSICIEVYAAAQIDEQTIENARQTAEKAVSLLDGAGVYGVEMFLSKSEILVNEIAPRVHNSGHYTMDACATSQFEQHIRAVTEMELGNTEMTAPACVMVNILGERNGAIALTGVEKAEAIDGVSVYIYGKTPTKVDRKMGHINAVAGTIEEAREKALKARKLISI
ncbi:5-(carboxyamino)imidazole ribonucleotide synthase [Candidatus Parcubacteria bacterium]|nr:5-(carboxyamino)imidazole ribonucleotide synthase [Candidatus Parcubacteria bacterium]